MEGENPDLVAGDAARRRGDFVAAREAYLRAAAGFEADGKLLSALPVLTVALQLDLLDDAVPARIGAHHAQLGLAAESQDWVGYAAQVRALRASWPAAHAVAELAQMNWLATGTGQVSYEGLPLAQVTSLGGPHWLVARLEGRQALPDRLVVALAEGFLDEDSSAGEPAERIVGLPDTRAAYSVSPFGSVHRATPEQGIVLATACLGAGDGRSALAFVQHLVSREETKERALEVVEQAFRGLGRDDKADVVKAQLDQLRSR